MLETDIKLAIVSLELVNIPEDGINICQNIVSEMTGTPKENIWDHLNHNITTPPSGDLIPKETALYNEVADGKVTEVDLGVEKVWKL